MPASSVSGGSGPGGVSPEAIIEWLQDEMGYPSAPPAPEQLRKICRGNMLPVWSFLLRRVRSERTVATARRNIQVHGVAARRAREGGAGAGGGDAAAREAEARERDLAAEEAERLRGVVRRQRKELRARIAEVAREEAERKRVLGERSNARYKYENEQVIDAASTDASSPLPYQVYGNGKIGSELATRGTYDQLLERQKEHVQQFLATEDALNKAAEAKALSQKLLQRLHGTLDTAGNKKLPTGNISQNVTNSRHLELDVWAKEREVAGLKASLSTLTSEVQRLYKLCAEWKEAEDSLKKKWKKIEEFDARRSELECIYSALLQANMEASAFWEQQPVSARGYASRTIIPACNAVVDMSTNSRDLIERELAAFGQSLENSLCRLPATPQALLEALGSNGATGSEALAAAEKLAAMLTARAGARDPSAVPSICRISTALQYNSVSPCTEGTDSGLASVLNSLEFCLKPCGSEASILEDLSKAINLVHTRRNLAENDRVLLNRAHRAQQEYERVANYCLKLAGEQEKVVAERWLPELRNAVQEAQRCFEDCRRVRGLVDEWYEQPAATIVDWVTIDGQSVGAWINLVKQLHMEISRRTLAMSSAGDI